MYSRLWVTAAASVSGLATATRWVMEVTGADTGATLAVIITAAIMAVDTTAAGITNWH